MPGNKFCNPDKVSFRSIISSESQLLSCKSFGNVSQNLNCFSISNVVFLFLDLCSSQLLIQHHVNMTHNMSKVGSLNAALWDAEVKCWAIFPLLSTALHFVPRFNTSYPCIIGFFSSNSTGKQAAYKAGNTILLYTVCHLGIFLQP